MQSTWTWKTRNKNGEELGHGFTRIVTDLETKGQHL